VSNLLHLIWFRLGAFGLQVQEFDNTVFRKDMMIAANPFLKSQPYEQFSQICKSDIGIGCTAKDFVKNFIALCHGLHNNYTGNR
jgi:hypothetical protein